MMNEHCRRCSRSSAPWSAAAGTWHVRLLHSPAHRWLPLLLLAAFAACDCLAQALLPAAAAAAAAGWIPVPEDVFDFLRTVVGLSQQAQGVDLALRLLRPFALLAAIAAYRRGYALGILHRRLQHEALTPDMRAARKCAHCSRV